MSTTYGILNKKSSKCYIGSTTTSLRQRLSVHYALLNNGKHWCGCLQADWLRLGKDAFEVITFNDNEDEVLETYPNEVYNHCRTAKRTDSSASVDDLLFKYLDTPDRWHKGKGRPAVVSYGTLSFTVTTLGGFARAMRFNAGKLHEVASGKRGSYKGFTVKWVG
ncbi:PfWMP3_41 [Phormidium phage Pf-WMP3]|uniref:PfWMP3_41 n=1 Tax=Phormidium phage Pf-WMP3 TaxID=2914005 RepID=A5HL21_9CAUD|nr:PfWMP3_41 [Phormidium phage Pf-WMP3]ABQ12481.1 PfWMP3_41 [Phormidium phage Pf-WMP3]